MVKVLGPLFSNSAKGKYGAMVFQSSPNGNIVRCHVPQKKKPSKKQLFQNYLFGSTADKWRSLSDEDKQHYEYLAKGKKMTGFNYYLKHQMPSAALYYGYGQYGLTVYV